MNEKIGIIHSLLELHDYTVKIRLSDSGCIVRFPKRCEYPQHDHFEVHYLLDSAKNYVSVVTTCLGESIGKIILTGPIYSHKSLIIFHIIKMCQKINYHFSLVQFYINEEEVHEGLFLQALTYPNISDTDAEKEVILMEMSIPAFQNSFHTAYSEMAEEQQIAEGYQSLIKMFKGVDDEA